MPFAHVTLADWRAKVEKELAGRPFDKTLVHETIEGLSIAPLYNDAPASELPRAAPGPTPFRICMRHAHGARASDIAADVDGGAEALWLGLDDAREIFRARVNGAPMFFVFDTNVAPDAESVERAAQLSGESAFALHQDPIGRCAAEGAAAFAALPEALAALGRVGRLVDARFAGATSTMVSTLPHHDAGFDAVDELAIALSTGVQYLEALRAAGLSPEKAAGQMAVQIAVGRDTFLELCKVRALRTCWQKLLAAAGATSPSRTLVHAVCSSRSLTVRDPWVNMLRVTTQTFSAVLGGADLVTPNAFDQPWGSPSPLGRRVARNTGLVLREESFLGKVGDPAGGSYYLETLTDALARAAWKRFREREREGGIVAALESGRLRADAERAWHARLERIAKRKMPILGTSEFANLAETLPQPAANVARVASRPGALPVHRDAETFEALRARAEAETAAQPRAGEAASPAIEALLVTLGTLAESRPRVGFATGFFSAGGIATRESSADEAVAIACLCGTDERYVAEAAARARALKAAGCKRVLVAGRPGALEAQLREAGVDGFIFVGCDVVDTLSLLLELPS